MNYAGIGSRRTPSYICNIFTQIAIFLAVHQYTLRSGAADGADKAFEQGCDYMHGNKEIYLPWKGFNQSASSLYQITPESISLASKYHPGWMNLKESAKKLIARNGYQILGNNLQSPVNFVICYTPNGEKTGGTAQAIKIAEDNKIPVFNAGNYQDEKSIKAAFNEFYAKWRVL